MSRTQARLTPVEGQTKDGLSFRRLFASADFSVDGVFSKNALASTFNIAERDQ